MNFNCRTSTRNNIIKNHEYIIESGNTSFIACPSPSINKKIINSSNSGNVQSLTKVQRNVNIINNSLGGKISFGNYNPYLFTPKYTYTIDKLVNSVNQAEQSPASNQNQILFESFANDCINPPVLSNFRNIPKILKNKF
jgi:hypothetical protein